MKSRFQIRFSLRTLLAGMIILCLAMGAFSLRYRSAERQRQAVKKLEDIGATCYYDCDSTDDETARERNSFWLNWMPAWLQDTLDVDFFHNVILITIFRYDDVIEDHEAAVGLASIELLRDFEDIEVEVWDAGDSTVWLSTVAPLKKVRSISLYGVCFEGSSDMFFDDAYDVSELLELLQAFHNITSLNLSMLTLDDAVVDLLKNRTELEVLSLAGASIPNDSLAFLQNLHRLRWLNLSGVSFTDEELAYLADLRSLEKLYLVETKVLGKGLIYLSELPHLRLLYLHSNIDDEGMQYLSRLVHLEELYLPSCDISDQGLTSIHELKALKRVALTGPKVTENGIRLLKEAIPQITVDCYRCPLKKPIRDDTQGEEKTEKQNTPGE